MFKKGVFRITAFGEVRLFVLLAVLQIRHFISLRVRLYSAHSLSRGAHVNLEANRVVDFSSEVCLCASRRYVRTLHVRKLACPCGHVFPAKAQQTKRKRPIESRQSDNVRKAAKRACETDEETRKRQTHNKEALDNVKRVNRPRNDRHNTSSTWEALEPLRHLSKH